MEKIIQFPEGRPGKISSALRQRLRRCKWHELDQEEQMFAAALCGLLGLRANRWINADIVANAGLEREHLF